MIFLCRGGGMGSFANEARHSRAQRDRNYVPRSCPSNWLSPLGLPRPGTLFHSWSFSLSLSLSQLLKYIIILR